MISMKMRYCFDWMKIKRNVDGQRIVGALVLLLTVVSCAIENDIPYPIVEGRITAFTVEGQRAAEGEQNIAANIDAKARTVTLYVNDSVDISRLKITQLVCNPTNATLLVDGSLCEDESKFPSTGFSSLDSIPISSNTRMDFTNPVMFTLRTYQDYVWTVFVQQIINREIDVVGITDYVIDESTHTVLIWVADTEDLNNLQVNKLDLGGEYGEVYPDPTTIKDYSTNQTFYVRYNWEGDAVRTAWTVKVRKNSEGGGTSTPTTNELSVNAWSKHAYVSVKATSADGWTAEYSVKGKDSWSSVNTNVNGNLCEATLKGLSSGTTYTCRMKDKEGNVQVTSDFTTESATALYNGNFDSWYQSGNTWYAVSEGDFTKGSFWDSSNPGTTQGAGSLVNINPTQGNSSVVHTPGGKSAELKSQYKVKFAAASLYAGSFGGLVGLSGAKINFGQPFTSRPTALHGWFQYAPKSIGYVGSNQPGGTVGKDDPDICSIYIALAKKIYTIDNTDISTFIQFDTDDNIIAYGELPAEQCVDTGGQWKEFTIDLKYKTLDCPKDMYLILVASSSKYGDYFTGGDGSIMYLDDFELIYGEEPVMWN